MYYFCDLITYLGWISKPFCKQFTDGAHMGCLWGNGARYIHMLRCNSKYFMYSQVSGFRDWEMNIFFFPLFTCGNRSGSHFVHSALGNLEQLPPIGIDHAKLSSTTYPQCWGIGILINAFLKSNVILECRIAFLIPIYSLFPLQIISRCMQLITTKWDHCSNSSYSDILNPTKPQTHPAHLYLWNLCCLYPQTILKRSDVFIFTMCCEEGK